MKIIKRNFRGAVNRRTYPNPSLFQLMSPAESRQARAIARQAALAVIG